MDKNLGGRPRKDVANAAAADPENGRYYTVTEAAALLGVHIHTIQARLRDGTLQGKKISGRWRIYRDSLHQ